jgi:hypothetical protein
MFCFRLFVFSLFLVCLSVTDPDLSDPEKKMDRSLIANSSKPTIENVIGSPGLFTVLRFVKSLRLVERRSVAALTSSHAAGVARAASEQSVEKPMSFKERFIRDMNQRMGTESDRRNPLTAVPVPSVVSPGPDVIKHIAPGAKDSAAIEDPRDFDKKKRKLLLLLDQAVVAKMKVTKVFPKKLAELGDLVW